MSVQCTHCQKTNYNTQKYCMHCGYELPNSKKSQSPVISNDRKPKKKFTWQTALGFFIGFIIMYYITHQLFTPSVDGQLVSVSNEINKHCPMQVDQYTILDNVATLPHKTIQYNYHLVNMDKSEINLDTVKKYVFPGLLANVKTNPDMHTLKDYEVTFKYLYKDKNGVIVTTYEITPDMYAEN